MSDLELDLDYEIFDKVTLDYQVWNMGGGPEELEWEGFADIREFFPDFGWKDWMFFEITPWMQWSIDHYYELRQFVIDFDFST